MFQTRVTPLSHHPWGHSRIECRQNVNFFNKKMQTNLPINISIIVTKSFDLENDGVENGAQRSMCVNSNTSLTVD